MTLAHAADDITEVLPARPTTRNICLDYTPAWTTDDEVMDKLADAPIRLGNGQLESDRTPNFPTVGQVQMLKAVHTSVLHSRLERNAADFGTQALVYDGAVVLAETEDAHGRTVRTSPISVPGTSPRGIFVAMPAETGESAVVRAAERFIGTKSHNFFVNSRSGETIDVNLVQSVTVPIPPTGSSKRFWRTTLKKFEDASRELYPPGGSGPFHRDAADAAVAMSALGIKHHLGALFVTGINARVMSQASTEVLLGELAEFTCFSGIPVVCFGTTGAVPRLLGMGAAVAPLMSIGGFSIPALQANEVQWELLTEHVWENFFAWVFKHAMPEWFAAELWKHTLGRSGLVMKLARYVFNLYERSETSALDKELLASFAATALKFEQAALKAIKDASIATRDGVLRNADWLSLETNTGSIPGVYESFSGAYKIPVVGSAS